MTGPDDGEVALSGPVTLRILEDGGTTAHRLGVAEIVIASHTEGPPQHRHGEHDEGFYVVSGTDVEVLDAVLPVPVMQGRS
jgi:mannose-6-phosphate isomerase-like protein (cupin superfamily)